MELIKKKMFPMSQAKWKNWNLVSGHNCWLSYPENKDVFGSDKKTVELQAHVGPSFQGCDIEEDTLISCPYHSFRELPINGCHTDLLFCGDISRLIQWDPALDSVAQSSVPDHTIMMNATVFG